MSSALNFSRRRRHPQGYHRRLHIEHLETRWLLAAPLQKFLTPLPATPFVDWTISNYVDLNAAAGPIRDYTGGIYTYDGHNGLDISLGSFARMDAGVPVRAVAGGTVSFAQDGYFDRNTTNLPGRPGNSVTINHGGGFSTVYAHLRRGSVAVSVGQIVTQGQVIGLVGSSGNSSGAHLHLTVLENGTALETYSDPSTYWLSPLPYSGAAPGLMDSGVTNYDPSADMQERPSDMNTFLQTSGQVAYTWGRFKGLRAGDVVSLVWRRPNGTTFSTSTFSALTQDDAHQWKWSSRTLPTPPDLGTWRVEFLVDGVKLGETSFQVAATGAAEIRVSESSTYVLDGRTTPIDFGSVAAGTAGLTKTFTVLNHGTAPLTLGSVNLPTGYTLAEGLATTLAAGASDTFSVRFDTSVPGLKPGQITFTTNDASEATFNFAIEGQVTGTLLVPEIAVDLAGTNIPDGSTTPISFGGVATGQTGPMRSFTVRNTGFLNLTLGPPSIPTGFTLVEGLATSLAPGGSDSFTVRLDSAVVGTKSGQVSFTTNDGDENPFNFSITGIVSAPPTISDILNQSTNEDTSLGPISFTIGDEAASPNVLLVEVSSSNLALVPVANLVRGGSGANRTLAITPAANQSGATTITVTVTNPGGLSASDTFTVTVNPVNDPPSIPIVAAQSTLEDRTLSVSFTVADSDTPISSLIVTASSSDGVLLPAGSMTVSGSGASRSVQIVPASDQSGTAVVTLAVNDGSLSASRSFILQVVAVDDPPTISQTANQTMNEDGTLDVAITLADVDSPLSGATISAAANNSALLPVGAIVVTGTGPNRVLRVVPAANRHGSALVTVTVREGLATSSQTFPLSVAPVNDPPTISATVGHIVAINGTSSVTFGVSDIDTSPETLNVTVASSNSSLLPAEGLTVSNTDGIWTLSLVPATDAQGAASVTVEATDGEARGLQTFGVIVSDRPHPWHNLRNRVDVNDDRAVSGIDVLLIFNFLNSKGTASLPLPLAALAPPFYDVFPDNIVAAIDALLVINAMNSMSAQPEGEGGNEDAAAPASGNTNRVSADLIAMLALDAAEQTQRKRRRG